MQSSVMLMMAIKGEIERPDHVIFADTGWEPNYVYEHARWCKKKCVKANIPFHIAKNGDIRDDARKAREADFGPYVGRWASMPLFVDTGSSVEGRIRRQCTAEYKLDPLRKKQRELLGYKPRQRIPEGSAAVMIGISTDEARRASASKDVWVDNVYPLIDPLKMSRADCQRWWEDNYPHKTLRKSACVGCPNRSDREWLAMKREFPVEFKEAAEFDEFIRDNTAHISGKAYLHRSMKPLDNIDFNSSQMGLDLEDDLYCAGGCGL